MTLTFTITYTLQLSVPTRFKAFDIVSQGGVDLKDCSGFHVFLNSYGLFYDVEISKNSWNSYHEKRKLRTTFWGLQNGYLYFCSNQTILEIKGVGVWPAMGVLPHTTLLLYLNAVLEKVFGDADNSNFLWAHRISKKSWDFMSSRFGCKFRAIFSWYKL